ncbi:MAG: diacylglycerol kinase family lipid kinase [Rikenellaceae bacterium]
MNKWFAIVNPVAGRCKGLNDWPLISSLLRSSGISYDAVFTQKKYHATELAVEAVTLGYRHIIVVGGDGTLHETVFGLFLQQQITPSDVTIAVIAVGTGNDWIRMYGISRKYSEAVKAIVEGETFLQDVAKIDYYEAMVKQTRYLVNMAGMGFDAAVNYRYNRLKEKGYYSKWLYIISLLRAVFTYKPIDFRITVDGKEILDSSIFSIAIAIGKYNGGGMMQAPYAIADDGLIDVTIIKKLNIFSLFRHIKKLHNGNIYKVPSSQFIRAKNIEIISTKTDAAIEVDGEPIGYAPINFSVIERAIKVIVVK